MPSGVSVLSYGCFTASAIFCMFIGSQYVHWKYQPLGDLEKYVEKELEKLPSDQRTAVRTKVLKLISI